VPLNDKNYLLYKFLVTSEVWYNFWGGDNGSKITFKLQKVI